MNESRPKQAEEKTIAALSCHPKNTPTGLVARVNALPPTHEADEGKYANKKKCGWNGPGHPGKVHREPLAPMSVMTPPPIKAVRTSLARQVSVTLATEDGSISAWNGDVDDVR